MKCSADRSDITFIMLDATLGLESQDNFYSKYPKYDGAPYTEQAEEEKKKAAVKTAPKTIKGIVNHCLNFS